MEKIGDTLKYIRENLGLTQAQLADQTGLSQQAISLWERDERAPNIYACIALADFYGLTIDELIGREFGKTKYGK